MTHTITSIQFLNSNHYMHEIYYGPVSLPDLNYVLEHLQGDEKDYLNSVISIYHFVNSDSFNLDLYTKRLREIFENHKDLFLSGKGLERSYLRFCRLTNKYTRKKITPGILNEIILNSKAGRVLYVGIFNAQAGKQYIKRENLGRDIGPCQFYEPTDATPAEILELALRFMDKVNGVFPIYRTRLQLALWIYQRGK